MASRFKSKVVIQKRRSNLNLLKNLPNHSKLTQSRTNPLKKVSLINLLLLIMIMVKNLRKRKTKSND